MTRPCPDLDLDLEWDLEWDLELDLELDNMFHPMTDVQMLLGCLVLISDV